MSSVEDRFDCFKALVRKHEGTIRRISASFYPVGSYDYQELVCDLTTYLWQVFRQLPPDTVINDEHAWVFVILHSRALNLVRAEKGRRSQLVYDADLTSLVDDAVSPPYVGRLYRLIAQLDDEDREIILMYVDNVPIKQIALNKDMSYLKAYRRIVRIQNKLCELNSIIDDDDDAMT